MEDLTRQIANINTLNGVPETFTKITGNGNVRIIQKGQLNKFRLRPQIINEHVESSRNVQASVDATTIVGQIFKASKDNINGISISLASAAGIVLDDFESYANDAALQAVWVLSGTNLATLETTIVKSGTKSMRLPGDKLNDSWINTIAATDYTDFTGSFDAYFTAAFSKLKVSVFIGDGTNTKSTQLAFSGINSWVHFEVLESTMTEDGGGATNIAAITQIGFRIDDKEVGDFCYIDNLSATPPPGSVLVKLWDFGATLPVDAVSKLSDATQYTELGDRGIEDSVVSEVIVPLSGGHKDYQLNTFVAGVALEIPSNTLLTVDNYYAITIHYVDTDTDVYGVDASFLTNYYENGYAFTTPDTATAISQIGTFNDLNFSIFSTQDAYIIRYFQAIVTSSGGIATMGVGSSISGRIEDLNMKVTDQLNTQVPADPDIELDLKLRPNKVGKGGKFEIYLNDDPSDDAFAIGGAIQYLYEPLPTNG